MICPKSEQKKQKTVWKWRFCLLLIEKEKINMCKTTEGPAKVRLCTDTSHDIEWGIYTVLRI